MKKTSVLLTAMAVTCLALFASSCATSSEKLAALAKVPARKPNKRAGASAGGKITESELEKENGKLVWSFDIATSSSSSSSKDITEIQVDAITGQIVSREAETPEQQAKEAGHR